MGIDFNLKIHCPVDVGDIIYPLFRGPCKITKVEVYYTLERGANETLKETRYRLVARPTEGARPHYYWGDEDFNKVIFLTPEEAKQAETNWLNDDTHIIRGSGPL